MQSPLQTDTNTFEGLDAEKSLRERQRGEHSVSSMSIFHWDHTWMEMVPSKFLLLDKV